MIIPPVKKADQLLSRLLWAPLPNGLVRSFFSRASRDAFCADGRLFLMAELRAGVTDFQRRRAADVEWLEEALPQIQVAASVFAQELAAAQERAGEHP